MKKTALVICFIMLITAVMSFKGTAADSDTNIALGCKYTIETEASNENAYPKFVTDDPSYVLTDGKKGAANDISTNWLGFYRGLSHTVTIDLKKEMLVSGYDAGFLHIKDYGIDCTRRITFAVSQNGTDFHTVDSQRDDAAVYSSDKKRIVKSFSSEKYYKARYVRLNFTSDVFAYVDELEIYGDAIGTHTETSYTSDDAAVYPDAFASRDLEIMDGASNIVLIYNGAYYQGSTSEIGKNRKSAMLPYAAYTAADGSYSDTMFDSYLFIPLAPGDGDGSFSKQSGWEYYLENTIGAKDGINMTALNTLVGEIKQKLSLPDSYKVNVFMTVPFFTQSGSVFGKLGTDKGVAPNSLENGEKIVKWFVDLSISEFEAQGFENLNLTGFYWYSESVRYTSCSFDTELIKYFTGYAHSLDYAAIWIPFYGAPGFWEWQELGFDVAALQSGYAFPKDDSSETGSPLEGTCYDSMSIAKKYGMGVEMELQLVSDAPKRYADYLTQAYTLGCMQNGISMYYQGGGQGALCEAAQSSDAAVRNIYDSTYKYIKRTFAVTAPYMEYDGRIIIKKDNSRNTGTLPIQDGDSALSSLKISELEKPQHGTFSMEGSGFFYYSPEDGFEGEDSFSFSITDGALVSEKYTVKIEVLDRVLYLNGSNKSLTANRAVIYRDCEKSAPENDSAFEIAIDKDGKVISASDSNGISVPAGGAVVAVSGTKADWARENVKVGQTVYIDSITDNIAFYDQSASSESSENADSGNVSENGKSVGKLPIITIVVAAAVAAITAVTVIIIKKRK